MRGAYRGSKRRYYPNKPPTYLCIFSPSETPTLAGIIADVDANLAEEIAGVSALDAAENFALNDAIESGDLDTVWVLVSEVGDSLPGAPWELYKVELRVAATGERVTS